MTTQDPIDKYVRSDLEILPKARPDDTVGSALERTTSSHEPVLVYDDNNEFKGIIYTSQSLFANKNFYMTKVQSALMVPPHINKDVPLYRLAEFMIMTRLYTLPVFEDGTSTLVGVVRIDDILQEMLKDSELFDAVEPKISIQKPITMSMHSTVHDIYKTMKREKVSRIVLVDKEGSLVSIVSRRDVQRAYTAETPRQRFGGRMPGLYYVSYYDDEKTKRDDEPVTAYYQASVLTADKSATKRDLLKLMLGEDKNSVVLTRDKKPVGFISRSDFIQAIAAGRPERPIQIVLADPKEELTSSEKLRIVEALSTFGQSFQKRKPIQRIEVTFKTVKNTVGDINEYEFRMQYFAQDGNTIVSHSSGRQIDRCIHELIEDSKRQMN